jgi:choline dehydrogenase-like flavoprotein
MLFAEYRVRKIAAHCFCESMRGCHVHVTRISEMAHAIQAFSTRKASETSKPVAVTRRSGVAHISRDDVILSAYTFENIRLLFLSGDQKHPNGLGNNSGQLRKIL